MRREIILVWDEIDNRKRDERRDDKSEEREELGENSILYNRR